MGELRLAILCDRCVTRGGACHIVSVDYCRLLWEAGVVQKDV